MTLGKLRTVRDQIESNKMAFCRDQLGATPLHKAIIYGQNEIVEFLLDKFPNTVHARDHVSNN